MSRFGVCNLKVLTLNCWGVFTPFVCLKRPERMRAIARELASGLYDIVLLQEIWTQADYELICKKLSGVMRFTHYFHSSMFGSGCCIFSKCPIMETFFHRFSINGYPHRIQNGDWYGGKGVGLCKILYQGLRVNVYVTHLHAEYSTSNDEYLSHRVVQMFEMSQFVKTTAETCDLVICGGDFNTRPMDPGYPLFLADALMKDAWLEQRNPKSEIGTSDNPTNSFVCKKRLLEFPAGERLDYLMFRSNTGYSMDCLKCYITFGRIPGEAFNYSDHEGVAAEFEIKRNPTSMGPEINFEKRKEHLNRVLGVIQSGMVQIHNERIYFFIYFLMAVAVLFMLAFTNPPYGFAIVCSLIRIYFTLLMVYAFWNIMVLKQAELNSLLAARKDMLNIVDQEKYV